MGWEWNSGEDWWEERRSTDWQGSSWEEYGGSRSSRSSVKRRWEEDTSSEAPSKRPWSGNAWPGEAPTLERWGSNSSWSSWDGDESWGGRSWSQVSSGDRADIQQWLECSRVGSLVPGTPIVPCKTPFEGSLANRALEAGLIKDDDRFGKEDLCRICEERGTPVGLVIDLVNTAKYYTGFDESDGIEYQKIRIPGRTVPARGVIEEIFDIIDDFVKRRPGEYVAMHCTHGINRTGFLVAEIC
eukprot:TRINITY_DN29446_c0_g1_i2.p1 TRINITY_DN29446_c0_g1~~TRINITY_DN29446_c0_g1_i2.p1  ORF type:complete len:242 (+),score=52.19 TRINITY_DN29446_c0_g1_i2:62-787(+)